MMRTAKLESCKAARCDQPSADGASRAVIGVDAPYVFDYSERSADEKRMGPF